MDLDRYATERTHQVGSAPEQATVRALHEWRPSIFVSWPHGHATCGLLYKMVINNVIHMSPMSRMPAV